MDKSRERNQLAEITLHRVDRLLRAIRSTAYIYGVSDRVQRKCVVLSATLNPLFRH